MENKRILVIYDHEGFQRAFKRYLGGTGFAVEGALSGKVGVRLAGETRFDLILIDYFLDKQGVETARDYIPGLRTVSPDVPIVNISALPSEEVEPVVDPATGEPLPFISIQATSAWWAGLHELVGTYLEQ